VKSKKAVLFSLMSLLLLISILVISNVYLQSNKDQNRHANRFLYASRLQFIENDVALDIIELLGLEVDIIRDIDRSSIYIKDLMLNDQSITLAPYAAFLKNNFSKVINNQINLTQLSEFNINNIKLDLRDKSVSIDNLSNIYSIDIALKATSVGDINNTVHPATQGSGSFVNVTIEDYNSNIVLDENLQFELGQNQIAFNASNGGEYVSLTLSNNLMNIDSTIDINLDIKITFIDNRQIKLTIGNSSMTSMVGIDKGGPILLAKG